MPTEIIDRSSQTPPAPTGGNGCSGETRQAILDAARSRFMHYGYKKTTIDDIAQTAGVGKGTVYLYFDNKEEILLTIARSVKHNITEQMQAIGKSLAPPDEKVRRMLMVKVFAIHDACQSSHGVELVGEMLQPRLMRCGAEEQKNQAALLAAALDEGVQKNVFRLPCPSHEAAEFIQLALVSFFPPYLSPCHTRIECRHDLENRANAMIDFLLWGLRRTS